MPSSFYFFRYDEAHAETTFIVPESTDPEMVMLQDFIQYWFKDFVFRSWEVLNREKQWDREAVKAITGALFQSLCSPDIKCLPYDLVSTAIRTIQEVITRRDRIYMLSLEHTN